MLEIRWNIFLLVYILSVKLYNIQVKCRRRVGQLEQMSLFALIVKYWCRTLYYPKQTQMMLLQCLNVTPVFSVIYIFFRKPCKFLPYIRHQKGCRGQKAVVLQAKIIQSLPEIYDQDNSMR